MKPTFANHVLVDANIAKSAAEPSSHPVALTCREVARTLERKDCPIGIAMTPLLQAEWRKHASRLMTRWLVTMETRGRVTRKPDKRVRSVRIDISQVPDAGIRAAMEKDLHLTEAAIANGWPVLSTDHKQKRYLHALHESGNKDVGRIHWANPLRDGHCNEWLMSGCSGVYDYRCDSL